MSQLILSRDDQILVLRSGGGFLKRLHAIMERINFDPDLADIYITTISDLPGLIADSGLSNVKTSQEEAIEEAEILATVKELNFPIRCAEDVDMAKEYVRSQFYDAR